MTGFVDVFAFQPIPKATTKITAGTTSTTAYLVNPVQTAQGGKRTNKVRVVNSGTKTVFLDFFRTATSVATASQCTPLLAGTAEIFTVISTPYAAAITASGTSAVYFTPGEGT